MSRTTPTPFLRPPSRPNSRLALTGARSGTPTAQLRRSSLTGTLLAGSGALLVERSQLLTTAPTQALLVGGGVAARAIEGIEQRNDTELAFSEEFYDALHALLIQQRAPNRAGASSVNLAGDFNRRINPQSIEIKSEDLRNWRAAFKALLRDDVDVFLKYLHKLFIRISEERMRRISELRRLRTEETARVMNDAGAVATASSASAADSALPHHEAKSAISTRPTPVSTPADLPRSAALGMSTAIGLNFGRDSEFREVPLPTLDQQLQQVAYQLGENFDSLKKVSVSLYQLQRYINSVGEAAPEVDDEAGEADTDEAYDWQLDRYVRYHSFCVVISRFIPSFGVRHHTHAELACNIFSREQRSRELRRLDTIRLQNERQARILSDREYAEALDALECSEWTLTLDQAGTERLLGELSQNLTVIEQAELKSLIRERKELSRFAQTTASHLFSKTPLIGFPLTEEQVLAILEEKVFIELTDAQVLKLIGNGDIPKKCSPSFDISRLRLEDLKIKRRIQVSPELREAVLAHNIDYALKMAAFSRMGHVGMGETEKISACLKIASNPMPMSKGARHVLLAAKKNELKKRIADQKTADKFITHVELFRFDNLQHIVDQGLEQVIAGLTLRDSQRWFKWTRDSILEEKKQYIEQSRGIIRSANIKDEPGLASELVRLQESRLLGRRRVASLWYSLFSPGSKTRTQDGIIKLIEELKSAQRKGICKRHSDELENIQLANQASDALRQAAGEEHAASASNAA